MSRLVSRMGGLLARVRRLPGPVQALAVLGLAALLAVALWLLLQVLPEARDETWDGILTSGVLRVCTDPSWPPFETIDEQTGELRGLDVDLAGHLAARLAPGTILRAEMVPVGFDSLYDALLAGRCDAVLSALPYEPERTRDIAYSRAYFNAGQVIVVRDLPTGTDGSDGIETVEDLLGRVVGVEWGWVAEGEPKQRLLLQTLHLRRFDTAGDVLRALHSGEIEVALVDQISALSYSHECRGVHIASSPITDVSYVVPVRPEAFRLRKEIERVLAEMQQDGTLAELVEKWF